MLVMANSSTPDRFGKALRRTEQLTIAILILSIIALILLLV
jgi:hypothetical protein